jgi:hypothetical protein
MIDPESAWIDHVNKLPPSKVAPAALQKLADAVDTGVSNKAELQGIVGTFAFTFNKAVFYASLQALVPTADPASGPASFASAWGQALMASIMVVPPGNSVGPASPPTTFSVVASTLIDPASLTLAQTYLQGQLVKAGANPVKMAEDGLIGPAIRQAFLKVTFSIIGLNSVSPPAGPLPLLAPMNPVA